MVGLLPAPVWEISVDLGVETEEGRVWRREGLQYGAMLYSTASMAAIFHLEISSHYLEVGNPSLWSAGFWAQLKM